MPHRAYYTWITCIILLLPYNIFAQEAADSINGQEVTHLTLEQCLKYAVKNQPALKQSYIDEVVTRTNNAINLSSWLPQVNADGTLSHYFSLPTAFFPNTATGQLEAIHTGLYNTATPALNASQILFSPDVLVAARTAPLYNQQAKQNTTSTKISLIAQVSKAFYNVLLSLEQIKVFKEDTARLEKNKSDTYHQYVSGVVDKVDYKQATISLNNSLAQLNQANESVASKYASLKQLMGYPPDKNFTVDFDTAQMLQDVSFDTTEELDYDKRIEYQLLETTKRILRETTAYYQLGFIPSLSAFYNYNLDYQNEQFSQLFGKAYPYSLFGLQFSVPVFQGFRRLESIKKSKLEEKRSDYDLENMRLEINTQYKQALAAYKSNLYNLHAMQDNVNLAKEVYNIVKLQYQQGIKVYLDVITAESDLRTSEINYLNALYQLLSSKIDLEQAMGDISPNL